MSILVSVGHRLQNIYSNIYSNKSIPYVQTTSGYRMTLELYSIVRLVGQHLSSLPVSQANPEYQFLETGPVLMLIGLEKFSSLKHD